MKKIFLTGILAINLLGLFAVSPTPAFAECTAKDNTEYCLLAPLPGIGDDNGKVNVATGFGDYLNSIIRLVIGFIGALAVIMLIVGGVQYMASDIIGEKEAARSRMQNAVLGLVIALGSYAILNTINPNLVDLKIIVPGAELASEEQELNQDGWVPPLPPVTGVDVPTGSAQDLAKQILTNGQITLGSDVADPRSSAQKNIQDTADGFSAWTSSRSDVGAKQINLDAKMLAGILSAAQKGSIQVNFIVGGDHSKDSKHYRGKAFDLQASSLNPTKNKGLMDGCRAAGATEILGPCDTYGAKICAQTGYGTRSDHATHIHCGWN